MSAPERVPLSEVCRQDRGSVRPGELTQLRYLGMESIESGTGQLALGDLAKTPEAPEANSFRFTPDHVLYGKLRPYLNKVFAPDFEGKCSTELVPLLPNERLDRKYLAYFLRSPVTVEAISQKVAGARMPRADMSFVMSLPIPILALKEQQRVVDLLSRAEGIVRMRREAEQKAKEIIPALFIDMFGDPATNPKGWEVKRIDELTTVGTGGTPSRDKPKYYGGDIPWVKTGEVSGSVVTSTEEFITDLAIEETNCKKFPIGTILIAMYGQGQTRGRAAILGVEAATNQACAAILPSDKVETSFLYRLLVFQYDVLRAMGRGGNQANLNLSMIKTFRVPMPDRDLQRKFANLVASLEAVLDTSRLASIQAGLSFQSLLAGVFGE